ncbi:MAG TPA: DUF5666 domain-containing protein [Candidatus Limnocylindrales bacterium]|nr:DUF5666 domain-containing protein [Candidatus Limnocylindrales bacterium]
MNPRGTLFVVLALAGILSAGNAIAQEPASGGPPAQSGQAGPGRGQEGGRGLFGKITAIHDGVIEITRPDGQVVSVKVTEQTEFRKDREAAKITDFKVGDTVMVRGDENADRTVTARMVGAHTIGPGGGVRFGGGMMGPMGGTLGKDFVVGEVKAIDAPRLTVLRPDNVTQTLELNEETSLRRGRESITMADIQVGDHMVARGGVEKDFFVPKSVMVMSAEQWQRMQEFVGQPIEGKPASPTTETPKSQEHPH